MTQVKIINNDGSGRTWTSNDFIAMQTVRDKITAILGVGVPQYKATIERRPAPVVNKNDIAFLFQTKRNNLLNEVDAFADAAANRTLGDYSEIGFLAKIMNILMED